jgi:hypothetical protein
MLADYLEKAALRQFCNLGIARNQKNLKTVQKALNGEIRLPHKSVSLHDYLSSR